MYPPPDLTALLHTGLLPDVAVLLRLAAALATERGLPLYLVGGTVRDLLLGLHPKDLDVTVEGDAPALAQAAAARLGVKAITHPRFGTATVRLPDGRELDLATARAESYSRPGALPEVRPGTLRQDLERRDFGLNAIAVRLDGPAWGEVADPLGGLADLAARQVRVLHDHSFVDDPTRMLRAVRYAGRLNFRLEPQTRALIERDASRLATLTPDRVRHELERILAEAAPERALALAGELGLLREICPGLTFDAAAADAFEAARRLLPAGANRQALGFALLAWDLPPDAARGLTGALNLTRAEAEAVGAAVELRGHQGRLAVAGLRPSAATILLDVYPPEAVTALAVRGDALRARERVEAYLRTWRRLRPALTGRDLLRMGAAPGPELGGLLRRLRAARLDGEAATGEDEVALAAVWLQADAETPRIRQGPELSEEDPAP